MTAYQNKSVKFAVALCAAGLFFSHQPAARAADADADRDYVRQATEEIMGDAAINRVAREKAENDEVKHYAADRVHLDEKIEAELRDVADRHHIALPAKDKLADAAQERLEHMRSSTHFDQDYLDGETRDTGEMAKLFKSASKGDNDPDMRDWFAKKAGSLSEQQEKVKALSDKVTK